MKIGIMSMQRVRNYGSFLQAYGLKKTLKALGAEVEFIDYKTEATVFDRGTLKALEPCRSLRRFWRKSRPFLSAMTEEQKLKQRFLKEYDTDYLPELGVTKHKKYRKSVDMLVIGSDEVFNCTQNNIDVGFSRELFGADNRAGKVISYAASFGNTTLEKLERYQIKEEVSELLHNFSSISVRDGNSSRIVETLTGKAPKIHIDPVLLYDFTEDIRDKAVLDNYIIVYAYNNRISGEEGCAIRELARKTNKKIVSISGNQSFADQYVYGHPLEMLSYFRHADYVFTDTFHGTIFSIISHCPFTTLVRRETKGRSYGNEQKLAYLLQLLGLEDRTAWSIEEISTKYCQEIDFSETDRIIQRERNKALEYLSVEMGKKQGRMKV